MLTFIGRFNMGVTMKAAILLLSRVIGVLLLVGSGVSYGANEDITKVKAAILFKLTYFVHWPEGKISDNMLDLCVLEDDSLYKELKTTEGKKSKGFQIRVPDPVRLKNSIADCEMLYLGTGSVQTTKNEAGGQPVLMVSDQSEFAKSGGMIQLRERGGRFRFIINLKAAKRSGLDISSQLLGMAQKVIK